MTLMLCYRMPAFWKSEQQLIRRIALCFLHIFFSAITRKYGSVEKFMEQELGLGKKELAVLRKKYTI
jgi:hypothetical protein